MREGEDFTDDEEPDALRNLQLENDATDDEQDCDFPGKFDSEPEDDETDRYPYLERLRQEIQVQRPRTGGAEPQIAQDKAFKAKDGTIWRSAPTSAVGRAARQNVFRVPANQLIDCGDLESPCEAFS